MTINDSRNLVILDGYVVEKPQLKEVTGGHKVVNLRVATNESYKPDGAQDFVEKPTFHDVTAWNNNAEFAAKYLEKGTAVTVWGKLVSNERSEDGQNKVYYRTYVRASTLKRGYNSPKEEESEANEG